MTKHAQLSTVRAGYDELGAGDPVVVLHGGVVDARFFAPNLGALAGAFHVFAPDLRGHGRTADVEGPFTYDGLANDTIDFINVVVGGPVHLMGHSVGAGVALHVALRRPDLVRRLALISGVFHHDGLVAGADDIDVDQVVAGFGAAYGEVSPDGEDHYPVVVQKIVEMDRHEPALRADALVGVTSRTLVMGSDDDIITLEHTIALYRAIPHAELAIVPGTSHFLTQEKPGLCNTILLDFLMNEPVETVAPIRRTRG